MARTAAVIVAAGRGERAGSPADGPKQYRLLGGVPVLRRAIEPFLASPGISELVVAIHPADEEAYRRATAGLALRPPVPGGASRQASVRNALEALAADPPDHVLVHDAARPLLPPSVIARVLAALAEHDGAVPALALPDTLKQAGGSLPSRIAATVSREALYRAQTPQAFRFAPLLAAHRRAAAEGRDATDDAALAEEAGLDVVLVEGAAEAMKITTAEDFLLAEALLGRGIGPASGTRTGLGVDVHRFGPGTAVVLGGVRIPHDEGLLGHSDADVVLHALTDAILGALAEGDIGVHFPPSDERWRGAPSRLFLAHAASLLAARSGRLLHADVTVLCERPRIAPHAAAMRETIASILAVDAGRVSVKATTTERLGFLGRGEGIAAQAVATVYLPAPSS
ncbi:MAG: bifunctional 2-C-methyl-D-erythritol 4-phosphate cytidylyltransferase/2-C-methyl-D-erythritol 2,4-cyclodiphosphate synthase [Alphaproteobacteria bacterium]|nr:bifunctional 2-C-methyl-D-erythritol 4-phosphate cytidylyltransferase/2-C-methyl-D-erythritol 2,4-cyclodiphosphate synthase [Alphaproteobacteria bacterium]